MSASARSSPTAAWTDYFRTTTRRQRAEDRKFAAHVARLKAIHYPHYRPDDAVVGTSAAVLHELPMFDLPLEPLTIAHPSSTSTSSAVSRRRRAIPDDDRTVRSGVPVTTAARTGLDLIEVGGPIAGLAALDSAVRSQVLATKGNARLGMTDPDRLFEFGREVVESEFVPAAHRLTRGTKRALTVLGIVSPLSESYAESARCAQPPPARGARLRPTAERLPRRGLPHPPRLPPPADPDRAGDRRYGQVRRLQPRRAEEGELPAEHAAVDGLHRDPLQLPRGHQSDCLLPQALRTGAEAHGVPDRADPAVGRGGRPPDGGSAGQMGSAARWTRTGAVVRFTFRPISRFAFRPIGRKVNRCRQRVAEADRSGGMRLTSGRGLLARGRLAPAPPARGSPPAGPGTPGAAARRLRAPAPAPPRHTATTRATPRVPTSPLPTSRTAASGASRVL